MVHWQPLSREENTQLNDMHNKHHKVLHALSSSRFTQRGEVHQLQLGNDKSYCHWNLETTVVCLAASNDRVLGPHRGRVLNTERSEPARL